MCLAFPAYEYSYCPIISIGKRTYFPLSVLSRERFLGFNQNVCNVENNKDVVYGPHDGKTWTEQILLWEGFKYINGLLVGSSDCGSFASYKTNRSGTNILFYSWVELIFLLIILM